MEPSPKSSVARRHSIRDKLEQLKKNQSAITIQSFWRGYFARCRFGLQSPPQINSKFSLINSKGNSSTHSVLDARTTPAIRQSIDHGEDDDDDDGEVMIDEEEEKLSEVTSKLKFPLVPMSWPEPFLEDFTSESWPKLSSDDESNEDWVYKNKCLFLRAVTWNLCAKKPPPLEDVRKILLPNEKFHIYAIGSEECERSIAQSAVNTSKKNWETYLIEALGPQYQPIRAQTLQAIHIMIFAHKSIAYLCSDVTSGVVPTGLGNTLGNKGAVGISFLFGRTKVVIVNAHLAAHQSAVKQRNEDFTKINREMPYALRARNSLKLNRRKSNDSVAMIQRNGLCHQSPRPVPPPLKKQPSLLTAAHQLKQTASVMWKVNALTREGSGTANIGFRGMLINPGLPPSLSNFGNRVIFMGDLNYRVRGNRSAVSSLIDLNLHEVMINNDQLRCLMESDLTFQDFKESQINFKPTYKLDRNSDMYDTSTKKRIPSWTDRILYIERGLTCLGYNADMSLKTSDHRPVYASFKIDVDLYEEDFFDGPDSIEDLQPFATKNENSRKSLQLAIMPDLVSSTAPFKTPELVPPHSQIGTRRLSVSATKARADNYQSKSAVCSVM